MSELPSGHELMWYRVDSPIGRGVFGVTYLATHVNLGHKVAIKEYFPAEVCRRDADHSVRPLSGANENFYYWGLERFLQEARTLARFKHPSIVRVLDYFPQNNTAYIVMDYEHGQSLDQSLRLGQFQSEKALLGLAVELLDGLQLIHSENYIHRDIKPANIYIRKNGVPVLLDFGSARVALTNQTSAMTRLASCGYAPIEQLSDTAGGQGPWTDIYGLAATMYVAVRRQAPVDAFTRGACIYEQRPDPLERLSDCGLTGYSPHFLAAIDHALEFKASARPQSAIEFRDRLLGAGAKTTLIGEPRRVEAAMTVPAPFTTAAPIAANAVHRDEHQSSAESAPEATMPAAARLRRARHAALAAGMVVVGGALLWRGLHREAALVTQDSSRANTAASSVAHPPPRPTARSSEPAPVASSAVPTNAAEQPVAVKAASIGVIATSATHVADSFEPEMLPIRGGSFVMGASPLEREKNYLEKYRGNLRSGVTHTVKVTNFQLGKYEVTVGQFRAFVAESGYRTDSDRGFACAIWKGGQAGAWTTDPSISWRMPGYNQNDDHPVACVSWNDAMQYAQWLAKKTGKPYRLPTEQEWEYAARGSTDTTRYWGDDAANREACQYANVRDKTHEAIFHGTENFDCDDGYATTSPVGRFLPNAYGLHDMLGNIAEWTSTPDEAKQGNYVFRGGSWGHIPASISAAYQRNFKPTQSGYAIGFRVAR